MGIFVSCKEGDVIFRNVLPHTVCMRCTPCFCLHTPFLEERGKVFRVEEGLCGAFFPGFVSASDSRRTYMNLT